MKTITLLALSDPTNRTSSSVHILPLTYEGPITTKESGSEREKDQRTNNKDQRNVRFLFQPVWMGLESRYLHDFVHIGIAIIVKPQKWTTCQACTKRK